jgi:hypothetical protein
MEMNDKTQKTSEVQHITSLIHVVSVRW